MQKIELLAPAGNLEKLTIAFDYGADAAYLGAKKFSLRNLAENFSVDDLKKAKDIALKKDKKIYLTLNIFPYNEDLEELPEFIEKHKKFCDGFIISDAGIINLCKEIAPEIPLHLSTQANTTNYLSTKFWYNQGIKRINLARELCLNDIKTIREKVPEVELEVFIHGAMCMAISGRCLLSNFLTGRASNKGECTHPCRWKYYFIEETRPNQIFEINEDNRGIYLFNSKDLCGIFYLKDLIEIGVNSLKIEGRMKSIYYVANVVRVYRRAIDEYCENPDNFKIKNEWLEELKLVSHRDYTKGFFEKRNNIDTQNIESSKYIRNADFVGVIVGIDNEKITIQARNKILIGEKLQIITQDFKNYDIIINEAYDLNNNKLEVIQPNMLFIIPRKDLWLNKNAILRRINFLK